MGILRFFWAVLTSRWLWALIGLALLSLIVWIFGPIVSVGPYQPLASTTVRVAVMAVFVIVWLVWLIIAQRRAIRANRTVRRRDRRCPEKPPPSAGEEAVAAVGAKFREVMGELKRRKLGGRRFLRELPWYVIVGPPATGKTTALRQSGLNFPIDLNDDLSGVGGTRNCDWFFSEHAVLIDTAGRYTEQESAPDADAAEWLGFLDLLKKHRGRRALNGVIVALAVDALWDGDEAIRAHARRIRRRLAEINERLEIRLPVYLMLTKADLIRGFEPFFGNLTTAAREQVWGTTFPADRRPAGRDGDRRRDLHPCRRTREAHGAAARGRGAASRRAPRSSAFRPRWKAFPSRSGSSSSPFSARAATRRAPGCAASISPRRRRRGRRSTA